MAAFAADPDHVPDWSETATADADGWVNQEALRNGWAWTVYPAERAETVLAEGQGFQSLMVNGAPFVGDFYRHGWLRLAIPLRAGDNRFLVRASRGGFQLRLQPAPGAASFSPHDALLPDLREGVLLDTYGAVVVLNHLDRVLEGAVLEVGDDQVFARTRTPLGPLLPCGLAKPPFRLRQLRQPAAEELDENRVYHLPVALQAGGTRQETTFGMTLRRADEVYRATKRSGVDGSVQSYAVLPPRGGAGPDTAALYLTLHGAGVEADGQARAYSARPDGYLVAPTNRRPFGFDWQEWGRLDALETLAIAQREYGLDPARIYLTGHSMGGHGVWYLGALYPSLFAALGPSAGWRSFLTYGGGRGESDAPSAEAFQRAQAESDTEALIRNYTDLPLYVLHGEKDDNVPVSEARAMVERLQPFHRDFVYHEQPGAGHWWDDDATPGAECVDWPPMFDFFRRHVRPAYPLQLTFTTPNPAVSAEHYWLTIEAQEEWGRLSRVEAVAEPRRGRIGLTTENVARLSLRLGDWFGKERATIAVEGVEWEVTTGPERIYLSRAAEGWRVAAPPDPWAKGPHRAGPFKLAFDRQMVWVYGTGGTPEENAAVLAKVRYDAQAWWYRANGHVAIIPDTAFAPERYPDRNVILYGHAAMNSAFHVLPASCPIRVDRGQVQVGDRLYEGDVGAFFVYPRRDSKLASVGVIGFTTPLLTRYSLEPRYFTSGVAYPDYTIFGPETLTEGLKGVREAGYFDGEWKLP